MTDIEDKSRKPEVAELREYVGNPLFDGLCDYMQAEYNPAFSVEYSGDKVLLGWNLKFKKCGRTLCTVYPRKGHFPMLLIVGSKEKERVEALLPELSEGLRTVYENTTEGMNQRWMLFDFAEHNDIYEDALRVVRIRRNSR